MPPLPGLAPFGVTRAEHATPKAQHVSIVLVSPVMVVVVVRTKACACCYARLPTGSCCMS